MPTIFLELSDFNQYRSGLLSDDSDFILTSVRRDIYRYLPNVVCHTIKPSFQLTLSAFGGSLEARMAPSRHLGELSVRSERLCTQDSCNCDSSDCFPLYALASTNAAFLTFVITLVVFASLPLCCRTCMKHYWNLNVAIMVLSIVLIIFNRILFDVISPPS